MHVETGGMNTEEKVETDNGTENKEKKEKNEALFASGLEKSKKSKGGRNIPEQLMLKVRANKIIFEVAS